MRGLQLVGSRQPANFALVHVIEEEVEQPAPVLDQMVLCYTDAT